MNLDKVLEFDKVKLRWKELAVTEYAHEKIDEAGFILSELECKSSLKDTTDARELIVKLGTPPLQNVTEIKEVMEIAKKGGGHAAHEIKEGGVAVRPLLF